MPAAGYHCHETNVTQSICIGRRQNRPGYEHLSSNFLLLLIYSSNPRGYSLFSKLRYIIMLPRKTTCPALLSFLSLAVLTSALSFDCKKIIADGVEFKLEALGGMHSLSWNREHDPGYMNTTWNIDICKPLNLPKGRVRDKCGQGTHSQYNRGPNGIIS